MSRGAVLRVTQAQLGRREPTAHLLLSHFVRVYSAPSLRAPCLPLTLAIPVARPRQGAGPGHRENLLACARDERPPPLPGGGGEGPGEPGCGRQLGQGPAGGRGGGRGGPWGRVESRIPTAPGAEGLGWRGQRKVGLCGGRRACCFKGWGGILCSCRHCSTPRLFLSGLQAPSFRAMGDSDDEYDRRRRDKFRRERSDYDRSRERDERRRGDDWNDR